MNFWKCYPQRFIFPFLHERNCQNSARIIFSRSYSLYNINSKQYISCYFESRRSCFKKTSFDFEKVLKTKDNVPPEYNLIYRTPLVSYLKLGQSMILLSSCAIPYIVIHEYFSDIPRTVFDIGQIMLFFSDLQFAIVFISYILFNIITRLFIAKCPIRIYATEDGKYKAVFIGVFPWNVNIRSFVQGEVEHVQPILYFIPWSNSYFKMKNQKIILAMEYFKRPSDFSGMLKK